MIIPIVITGLISSLVIELLKVFPVLSKTDERKKAVAFLATLLMTFIYVVCSSMQTTESFLFITGTLSATFVIYKSIIQPIEGIGKGTVASIKSLII